MKRAHSLLGCLFAGLAAVVFGYLVFVAGCYGVYDGYLDHGEPVIAAAAFRMLQGGEVYASLDGPDFISNVYGPYLYLANGLFLWLLGASTLSGKISGLLCVVASVLVVWWTYLGKGARRVSLGVVMIGGILLLFAPYSFWNRPDPFLIVLAALSVLVAHKSPPGPKWMAWAVLGLIGGLACGLKIYGPVFIAPAAMLVALRDKSPLSVAVMSVTGAAVALIPFALPMFPLDNYLWWFSQVAAKPNDAGMVAKALRYGVIFLVPAAVLLAQRASVVRAPGALLRDPQAVYALLGLVGMAVCVTLAAKPGAGMYYLLPFAPVSVDLAMRSIGAAADANRARFAWFYAVVAAAILITAVPVQKRYFRALDWERTTAIRDDLQTVMRTNRGKSIQMAIGSSLPGYHNTLQKTELVYAGNPYNVDFAIMIETSAMGLRASAPLIASIKACRTDIWLVPKGEAPLSMNGYYGNKVIGEAFREAFLAHYEHTGSSAYFDVWACKRAEN